MYIELLSFVHVDPFLLNPHILIRRISYIGTWLICDQAVVQV